MNRFAVLASPVLLALGFFSTGCAEEAYTAPVQPSMQGRASLMANPPSEPVPFAQPAPPPPVAAPPPMANQGSPASRDKAGPLPALPSQAPMYAPPEPPPQTVVVVPSYTPYYVYDYPTYYYYRPRSYVHFGVGWGPHVYYRPWVHHRFYWAY